MRSHCWSTSSRSRHGYPTYDENDLVGQPGGAVPYNGYGSIGLTGMPAVHVTA